jgi:tRNA threonylcarbamoyladenosine modification (KEOPS) complex  Pcc1 subunit
MKFLKDFSRPEKKWIKDIYRGILKSRDVKLSEIARSIKGDVRLIENRLSLNLQSKDISSYIYKSYLPYVKNKIKENTFITLDLSDIYKKYAKSMEHLGEAWNGSEGKATTGYWLISLIAHNEEKENIIPLYKELYSQNSPDFESENAVILNAIKTVKKGIGNKGIIMIDRGGDRKILFRKLVSQDKESSKFLIRMNSKKRHLQIGDKKLYPVEIFRIYKYKARFKKKKDGREETKTIRYAFRKVRIPEVDGDFTLIGIQGLGNEPLFLITNVEVKDRKKALWLIKGYLSRWIIEESFRWIKQSYNVEDIRVQKYQSLRNIITILFLIFAFLTTHLLLNTRLKFLLFWTYKTSQRLRNDIDFVLYALSRGVSDLFYKQIPTIWELDSPGKQLRYLTLFDYAEKKS